MKIFLSIRYSLLAAIFDLVWRETANAIELKTFNKECIKVVLQLVKDKNTGGLRF